MDNSKPKVIVQIGHDALVQLLGGTDEAAIELRQSVVSEFSRHYLKGVLTEEIKKELWKVARGEAERIAAEVREELTDSVKRTYGYTMPLNANTRALAQAALAPLIEELAKAAMGERKKFTEIYLQEETVALSAAIDKGLAAARASVKAGLDAMNERIQAIVGEEIEAEVRRRVQERLAAVADSVNASTGGSRA